MAYPPISPLGPVPQRTQTPSEFAANADSFLGALPNFRTELNALGGYLDTLAGGIDDAVDTAVASATAASAASAAESATSASESASSAALASGSAISAASSATSALTYKDLAASNASFKGLWSNLAGTLNMPASVYHNGIYWNLTANLANVTAAEPGVSASWIVANGDSFRKYVDSIFSAATLDLDFASNSHKVYEEFGPEPKQLTKVVSAIRGTTATYNSPFGIRTSAINTPRIEYDPATGEPLGLLSEETRTNLLLHSQYTNASGETPPTGWLIFNNTGVTTTAASPRFSGAIRATQSGTAQRECYVQTLTLPAGTTYTFSAYFAAGTSADNIILRVRPASGDTPTGTLTLPASAVTAAGTYSVTFTTVSGGSYEFYIGLGCSASATGTVIHETPQLEVGSFPTSRITTTTATVTRNADQYTATLPATTEGTIFCVARGQAGVAGVNQTPFTLSDGTSNNHIVLRRNNATAGTQYLAVSGGVNVAQVNTTPKSSGQRNKFAISWKTNQFLGAEDGVLVLNDAGGTAPVGMTQLGIGSAGAAFSGAESLNGTVERIVFIPRALTAAELQAITL